MPITLIAAAAKNGVIGSGNKMLWKLPAEMAYFKSQTLGKVVLMGRKTFESIGKPLKDRTNVILSRTLPEAPEGAYLVRSIEEAVARFGGEGELMVIGGAEIYELALKIADRVLLTELAEPFEGDAYFPRIDDSAWSLVSSRPGAVDEKNAIPHTFNVYERTRR